MDMHGYECVFVYEKDRKKENWIDYRQHHIMTPEEPV